MRAASRFGAATGLVLEGAIAARERAGFAVGVLLVASEPAPVRETFFDAAMCEVDAEVRLEVAVVIVELDRLEAEALVDAVERLDAVEDTVALVLLCVLAEAVREAPDDALDVAAAGRDEAEGAAVLLVAALRLFGRALVAADEVPPMLPAAVAVATLPGMMANELSRESRGR